MKSTMTKIKKLSDQKIKLETELKDLLKERNQFLISCLDALPTQTIATEILLGGIMELVDIANDNAQSSHEKKEAWHLAGEKFCRKLGSKAPKTQS